MTRVSIYMSSYNHAQHLRAAIDSVLDQSYRDFELFIIDDSSTDDSWSIIQSYTDPRIRTMRNEVNRNDKAVMRRIIDELAIGDYFAVHHSDNIWEPGKLQAQVDFLDAHPQMGAVFTNTQLINEDDGPITENGNPKRPIFDQPNRTRHEWLNYFFYHGNALCHPSILIRRECYRVCGTYRDGFAQIPDLDMWVRLCLKYPIHVLPEKLVRYRVPSNESYISSSHPETRVRNRYEFLKVLENYLQITDWQELEMIFPEATKYQRPEGYDTTYALARLALEAPDRVVTRLFGLNILFGILNDPERMKKVSALYGFTHKDFIALNAENDIFSTEQLLLLETDLEASKHRIHNQARELRDIKTSRGWRFINFWRRVQAALLPAGSRRAKVARAVTSVLVFPFSFGRRHSIAWELALIRESGLFNADWYLARYPDVALSGTDPARHYLLHGGLEGRDPGPNFSSEWYIANYPEIVEKRVNPLVYCCTLNNDENKVPSM